MKKYYEPEELEKLSGSAQHVVNQIDRLRKDALKKGKKIPAQTLKIMAESMSAVAESVNMQTHQAEWSCLYQEMYQGKSVEKLLEKLLLWENDVLQWVDKVENTYGFCNLCKMRVIYEANTTDYRANQKEHAFPYWNGVFESIGREKRTCPVCESMDRERMLSLFIDMLMPAEGDTLKVLQIAPSKAMDNWLSEKSYMCYESTDLMMPDVTFQADIQNMHMVEDNTYDIILCSYILEHVEDDRKAMAELKRILKDEGVCLFLVPLFIGLDKTDEEFGLSAEENWKRFGQDDHARLYAKEDFLDRLTDVGYRVHILGKEYFGEECWKEQGLRDIHCIYAATKGDIGIGVEPYQKQSLEEELVSVVIPTYNRAFCIEGAIKSVLNQTWKNLELIIVDDASTDNTEEIVKTINDDRITYIKLPQNAGANHARNVGIQNAKGKYIAFNDSDDHWVPEKLEKQMKLMRLEERIGNNVGCVYCIVEKTENGKVTEIAPKLEDLGENLYGDLYKTLQECMFISTQTMLVKKSVFEDVGYFNENLKRLQDWELLLRISQKYQFSLVQEVLVNAYIQKDCISRNSKGWLETVLYVIELHNLAKQNPNAYKHWVRVGVSLMKADNMEKEYKESVISRVEKDKIFTAEEITSFKRELGIGAVPVIPEGIPLASGVNKEVELLKSEMQTMKAGIEKNDRMLNEILWSQVFNSSRPEFPWLKDDLALWPGRWGVGYQYMYAISRFLTELKPTCILETGLGQSTRLIGSYVKWVAEQGQHCNHTVVEHDKDWVDIFRGGFTLGEDSKVIQRDLARINIEKDGYVVPTYVYKDMDEVMQGKKFDFISIDAPYGTDERYGYSRIDIVNYLPDCLAESFCIVLDDYNRWGEKNTVEYIKAILSKNNIKFCEAVYRGTQDMYMLVSPDWKYLCTL